jgi:HlyD family secretion protein
LNAIKVRQAEIITADAQIVRAQAAVSQAKTNQEFTEIRSPRDGVVLAKNVEQGTIIASSRGSIGATNAMLQIGDVSKLWIVCNVDETDIAQVSVGQDVSIKVDAYPSQEPSGKVIRIDPQAKVEQNVTLIPVTVEIDDPDVRFKPLMNAECEFIVDEAKGVVTVPNEALKEAEDIYKVQKAGPNGKPELGPDGKPKETEVRVGLAGPDRTEIREGLQAGDKVITKTIVPEKPQTNNPFNPFGGMNKGGKGGGGGGGKGGGGKGGGGGR